MELEYVRSLFFGSVLVVCLSLLNLLFIVSSDESNVLVTSSLVSVGVIGIAAIILGFVVIENSIEKTAESA
jgi:predicted naringenin-chalcone synthase